MDSKDSVQIERLVSPLEQSKPLVDGPASTENSLNVRPKSFDDYPGQTRLKENLRVFVESAQKREQTLDHILLHGPPGLGKTTLANIVANELGVGFYSTSGPAIDKLGTLVGMLLNLEEGSLLFIDEIHRLPIQVEEVLYSAMEDFTLDIIVGSGPSSKAERVPVSKFTLVGATTRAFSLSQPLLSRFGIQLRLDFYDEDSLTQIIMRSATILGIELDREGALEVARRSRGTPRIANRLLRRIWDFATVRQVEKIDHELACGALNKLDIDSGGLDRVDRKILRTIRDHFKGGPVGLDALALTMGEDRSTLEEVYEPYLLHSGLLTRGPRGRVLTERGIESIRDELH